jgi:hypothetical protein
LAHDLGEGLQLPLARRKPFAVGGGGGVVQFRIVCPVNLAVAGFFFGGYFGGRKLQ